MSTAPPRCAVVLLSGGLDSATALAMARSQGFECYALSVDYGQRHSAELDAARRVAAAAGVRDHRIMRLDLAGIGGSALTDKSIAVPDSPTTGIPVTYVPARNTIMLSLALGWAEVLQASDVFVGVNAVDFSVSGDTRVWVRGRLGARLMSMAEACELPGDDYETLAVDKDTLRVCWKRILGRFRHDVSRKRCFRVQLERGQRIDVTEDHSLFSLDAAGDVCTVRGDEIVVGMPLVVPFDLSEQATAWSDDLKTVDLAELGPTPLNLKRRSSVVEDDAFLTNRLCCSRVPMSLPITDDFLRVVGLWLAEGGKDPESSSRSLQFSVGGLTGAPHLLKRYFRGFGVEVYKSSANDFDYRLDSSVFYEVFRRLGLLATAKSGNKRFPHFFWQLSQRQRRILVAGLWDGDGCQVWKGEAPMYQKSHAVIDDLYHCLLIDGIFCTLKPAAHSQKRLALTRAVDFSRFVELYPLEHPAKLDSLRKASLVVGRDKTTGLWKSDAVWAAVANAPLPPGMKGRIYNYGGKYENSVRAQRSAFAPVSSLSRLRDSKLAFLRVISIEPVSYEHMYDFSVEGAENFLANGFLAHNSGYPDCRPEFIAAFSQLASLATKAGVEGHPCRIHAPLISLSKAEIIREGARLGVDYGLTVSCYQADSHGRACGRCDSCRIRREGFVAAGVSDPTSYQSA